MRSQTALALAFTAVFIVGALLVFFDHQNSDPLAQFRTSDGKLSIPGGALTKELRQLLFPPKPSESYYTYQPARSLYPTLLIQGIEHKTSEFAGSAVKAEGPVGFIRPFAWLVGQLKPLLGDVFGFFMGGAAAATKTWDNGCGANHNWECAANWSGDTLPDAYDDVVFNGTSTTNADANIVTPALKSLSLNAGYTGTVTLITTDQTAPWGLVTISAGTLDTSGKAAIFGQLAMNTGGTLTLGASSLTLLAAYSGVSTTNTTGSPLIATTGLLRSYDMATETGGALKDFSPAANNAVEGGGVTVGGVVGEFGNATAFDHVDDKFTGTAPGQNNSFTEAMWLLPSDNATFELALSMDNIGCNYIGYGNTAGKFSFAVDNAACANSSYHEVAATVGIWHSVVNQFDGTTHTYWVDGQKFTFAFAFTAGPLDQLHIGVFNTSLFWHGNIDEIVISSRVWSDLEVQQFSSLNGNGNWSGGAGNGSTFNPNTSTVKMGGTAPATIGNGPTFKNLTILAAASVKPLAAFVVLNVMTIGDTGAATWDANSVTTNLWRSDGGSALSINASSTLLNTGGNATTGRFTYDMGGGNVSVLGFNYGAIGIGISHNSGSGTATLSANLTTTANLFVQGAEATGTDIFNLNGKNLTVLNLQVGATGSTGAGVISAGASTVVVTGDVTIGTVAPNSYITMGSSTWTVSGAWTNSSTSASWAQGTSSVTFNSTTAKNINAGNFLGGGGQWDFHNVTFNSGASTVTFTLVTNSLGMDGAFLVQGGAGTTTLNTNATFSWDITKPSSLTVGSNGVLTANGSTITVGGNWGSSAGTFTQGTSTVVFAAAATLTTPGSNGIAYFYNLTVNTGVTVTLASFNGTSNNLTVSGTGIYSGSSSHYRHSFTGGTTQWTLAATDSMRLFSDVSLRSGSTQANAFSCQDCDIYIRAAYTFSATMTVQGRVVTGLGTLTFSGSSALTLSNSTILSLNAILLIGFLGSGTGVIFSSGALTVNTVTITNASDFIQWGSSTGHTISGAWTNPSTSASWSAGTSTVTFTSTIDQTITFGDPTNYVGGVEFHSLTFASTSVGPDAVVFTPSANINISGALTVDETAGGKTLLNLGTNTAQFVSMHVTATVGLLNKDGFLVTGMDMSTDSGTVLLSQWQAFVTGSTPNVQWVFDPSGASATVTVILFGLDAGTNYVLKRDNLSVQTSTSSGSGAVTFSVAGGWSSHIMSITKAAGGGGGGGGGNGGGAGSIQITPISGSSFQFSVVPPSGVTVVRVVWDFGDGKAGTGNPVIHSYLQAGAYTVAANATYSDSTTANLTTSVTVLAGPDIISYIVAIIFIIGFAGAIFVHGSRRKLGFAFMGTLASFWMLYTFSAQAYPVFVPKLLVLGVMLLGGLAAFIVAFLPAKPKTKPPRGGWIVLGIIMLLLYAWSIGLLAAL